jgi:hypothetical protein
MGPKIRHTVLFISCELKFNIQGVHIFGVCKNYACRWRILVKTDIAVFNLK